MKLGKYEITAKRVVISLSAILVIFTLYCRGWLPPSSTYVYRGFFVAVCILLVPLINPPKGKIGKILIIIFTIMALAGTIYPMICEDRIMAQYYMATETDIPFGMIFLIGFFAVLSRVPGGKVITALAGIVILYMLLGHHVPGLFFHKPISLIYIVGILFVNLETGVFGLYAGLGSRLLAIFIMFATFLMTTGLGDLLTALASRVTGSAEGGPAKVAVISSGLFGMISGSSAANVATTGSFTIPLMKSIGYKSSTAASVEALASSGGGLMPPIMGLGAFLMADILGIPYLRVCLAALIPVFFWYFTIYLVVHYQAVKKKMKKWQPSHEELMRVIKARFHLIFAIFALIGGLLYFAAAEQGAFWAFVFLLVLTNLRKDSRLTKAKVADFLERYARTFASLIILLLGIGIFVGAIVGVGIPPKIGSLIFGGVEQWYLILLIAAVMIVMFGMALPVSAAYLSAAVIIAPLLARLGYNPLVIHMFAFYVATLAPITPPVCIATFTAARIAGSDSMKTGIEATLRALPLWIIPFAIFKEELLFGIGTPLSAIGMGVAILCFGVFMFVLGSGGFFRRDLELFEKILAAVTGIMIVQPVSDFYSWIFVGIGILLLTYWYLPNFFKKLRLR